MEQMDAALHTVLDENDALKVENVRLQAKLDGLMEAFDKNGSLGILQLIAADKNLPVEIRIRAAAAAVPFERPKLAVTAKASVVSLYDVLERHRQTERVIVHQPETPDPAA
jgi:hypothetical protein